jgi:hypothetical protein
VRVIGILTTLLGGLALTWVAVVGLRSVPEVKRYLAIRRM